jgi:hypothetical protein
MLKPAIRLSPATSKCGELCLAAASNEHFGHLDAKEFSAQ